MSLTAISVISQENILMSFITVPFVQYHFTFWFLFWKSENMVCKKVQWMNLICFCLLGNTLSPRHLCNCNHSLWCRRARHTKFKNCILNYTTGTSWKVNVQNQAIVWWNQSQNEHSGPRGESFSHKKQTSQSLF